MEFEVLGSEGFALALAFVVGDDEACNERERATRYGTGVEGAIGDTGDINPVEVGVTNGPSSSASTSAEP